MPLRPTTASNYARVLMGLEFNQVRLLQSQEQVATGRRILRPSDDPVGSAHALSFTRRLAHVEQYRGAAQAGRDVLEQGAARLQDASSLLTDVRELFLQGMSGTLTGDDREAIAIEIEVLRDQLVELANTQSSGRYLFGGTADDGAPWVEANEGGLLRAHYTGSEIEPLVRIGADVEVPVTVTGSRAFGVFEPSGVAFAGLTGVSLGTTANEGTGYEYLEFRHDATDPGSLATVGVALVDGGSGDTILGDQSLTIDPVAGTVQLGSGTPIAIPGPGSDKLGDLVVRNELGGELHLDLSGYTGAAFSDTVRGEGSVSIDGQTYTPLSFTETDLELRHGATGAVLHVDTTGVGRAGVELAQFSGTVNVFDTLQGMVEDLRNDEGLNHSDQLARMNQRLEELDRNHDNLVVSLGVLGARSARLQSADTRLEGLDLQLNGLLSEQTDADLSEVVVDMLRSEQGLQLAQASGTRLIQNSLLNFLR